MKFTDNILLLLDSYRFLILSIIKNWDFIYDAYLPMLFEFFKSFLFA